MTSNLYFNNHAFHGEQNLIEDLIDVLDTYITLGEEDIIDDWDSDEID